MSTIQKCLSELIKPQPDISYVRGMLEVLAEKEDIKTPSMPVYKPATVQTDIPPMPKAMCSLADVIKTSVTTERNG